MSDFRIKDEQLKELGDYLKKVRESKDYSYGQVAAYTNLNKKEIFMLENGQKKKPNPFYLKALSAFYKIDLSKLYKIIGYMDNEGEMSDEIEDYKIDDEMLNLLKLLDVKSQKNILNEMVEKIEYIKKSFELEKIRIKQDMPFDLFTDVFLKNREEIIAYKMQQILENDAEKILEENYNLAKKQSFKNNNRIFRMLERDIDRFKIEDLKLIFKYYNIEDIVRVLLFYMNNIAQNRSGFPDLMIFNENELKFIEVKGPNDTIKEHQIEKIMLLNQNNIKSEILTINHTERKLNNLTKKIKENSESIIIKYPESLPTFLEKSEKHNLNSYLEYGENNGINIFAFIIIITFIIAFFPFYILYLIFKKKR